MRFFMHMSRKELILTLVGLGLSAIAGLISDAKLDMKLDSKISKEVAKQLKDLIN